MGATINHRWAQVVLDRSWLSGNVRILNGPLTNPFQLVLTCFNPATCSHPKILDVWIFGQVWCRGWLVTDVWISTASILNLCAISIDRYVAVTRPVKYRSIMTPRRAKTIVACVWILAFLICFPPLLPQWKPAGLDEGAPELAANPGWLAELGARPKPGSDSPSGLARVRRQTGERRGEKIQFAPREVSRVVELANPNRRPDNSIRPTGASSDPSERLGGAATRPPTSTTGECSAEKPRLTRGNSIRGVPSFDFAPSNGASSALIGFPV